MILGRMKYLWYLYYYHQTIGRTYELSMLPQKASFDVACSNMENDNNTEIICWSWRILVNEI